MLKNDLFKFIKQTFQTVIYSRRRSRRDTLRGAPRNPMVRGIVLGLLTLGMVVVTTVILPKGFSVYAQSRGTAGFSSGAGNTTTSNTVYSVPSLTEGQKQQIENEIRDLQQGDSKKQTLSRVITSFPATLYAERSNTLRFQNYLGLTENPPVTFEKTQSFLQQIADINDIKPAVVYITLGNPPVLGTTSPGTATSPSAQLQILVITAQGALPIVPIEGVSYAEVLKTLRQFERNLSSNTTDPIYRSQAAQLYQWLIAPIQSQLQAQNINNLTFILGDGLRTIPLAALYNAQTNRFLVEDYTLGLMPSLSLIDLTPKPRRSLNETQVLAMGAETFPDQNPLPAVPIELSEITKKVARGEIFLNQAFTVDNLKQGIDSQEFNVVHLATHGVFRPGDRRNSYIYFSDQKLDLDQFAALGLDNPKIDLLVLSACKTAFGDTDAELGFAGLAIKTGVRTALGSLWNVSDEGTLALMTLFYEKLKSASIKSEALRQAQLAILKGNYQVVNNQLILDNNLTISLTPELVKLFNQDLRHPYYWSAFTIIGNPW